MLETLIVINNEEAFQYLRALREFPFFASFSPVQLQEIIESGCIVSSKAGEVIISQGERANAMFLILEGGVKVEGRDDAGVMYSYGEMGRGQFCGELGLLRNEPSRGTFTTVVDSEFLVVYRATLLNIINRADAEQVLNFFQALNKQSNTANDMGFREILSRRTLASQMEVEKQRALTQMVAGVAHEINTPLGVIIAAVNIMARELAMPVEVTAQRAAEIAESLELMRLNVERADRLMQDFKKVSISQLKDEKELLNISETIEEIIGLVLASLKRSKVQVHFHNELPPENVKWMGYRGYLSQVLINLLMNTERYAYPNGQGGVVDVTIALDGESGKNYRLTVQDQGKGISIENQAHIFDPFFTTGRDIGGTGLGLAIVHNLVVNDLKGEIKLKSEIGKGTEFVIVFPGMILE
jgi:signal transduction histidine kinase